MPLCDCCGDDVDGERYRLKFEYPPEAPDDPGEATLSACAGCAGGVATNVLVDRAISRDVGVYDGLGAAPGVTAGE